jgi:deoxyribodipyrimidine photolyase-related protein
MSDHCRGCAFDPRKRLGDDACPFTAGYWAWTHRHRDLLAAHHRTARAVAGMRRLTDLDAVLEQESAREHF